MRHFAWVYEPPISENASMAIDKILREENFPDLPFLANDNTPGAGDDEWAARFYYAILYLFAFLDKGILTEYRGSRRVLTRL